MRVPRCPEEMRSSGRFVAWVLAGALLAVSQQALTHHSYPPLRTADGEEVIRIYGGSIELFKLINPHSAMIVNVTNDSGEDEGWLIELSAAHSLLREGWTDETLSAGDKVTIAILASLSPNRGRLRALLVHGQTEEEAARLIVAYGIRGGTPVMRRLQERLPICGDIETRYDRTACCRGDAQALLALEEEFPGPMGYVMP